MRSIDWRGIPASRAMEKAAAGDIGWIVPAFERLEVDGVEGRIADAHPVDAAIGENSYEFRGHGFRVALDRELARALAHVGEGRTAGGVAEQSPPEIGFEEGWSSSPDKYRLEG